MNVKLPFSARGVDLAFDLSHSLPEMSEFS